jgi:hypothetical protein
LAISNPIVVICMWTAPLNVVRFGATTLWHLDAEERAPSTTSIASFARLLAASALPPIATESVRATNAAPGQQPPHAPAAKAASHFAVGPR